MTFKFRYLRADEVELRVSTCSEKGFSLLLYKDARCDQNILDETVGAMNWQRHHSRENANCTVSIWDHEKQQWVEKEDTGTESFTEKEKGLASDSFKRACFNWGIGRELYTAPFIWIEGHTTKNDRGKYVPEKSYDRKLRIAELVTEDGVISKLVIKDKTGKTVFSHGKGVVTENVQKSPEWEQAKEDLLQLAEMKGVSIAQVCEIAKVDSITDLSVSRLEKAKAWLAGQ